MAQKLLNLLGAYRQRRDPERTPEPFGGRQSRKSRLFVVQKHAARRLHYDLRLEMDGVLKSWAVPKGPSVKEKRLAVEVEDHPVEYADFEGIIPKDNYGAGAVIVWDRGGYRVTKDNDPLEQLSKGKIEVELFGFKLRGKWILARMHGKTKEWLFFKAENDLVAKEEPVVHYPESIISGLTIEELKDSSTKVAKLHSWLSTIHATRAEVAPKKQRFMLSFPAERSFSGKDWLFEIKYDGIRFFASRESARLDLFGRRGQAITSRFPEIVAALRALPIEKFLIDGELVALDENGRPSFQRLQQRMHLSNRLEIEKMRASLPVTAIFFDCLAIEGYDLRALPLIERKEALERLLPSRGLIQYGGYILEHGEAFFEAAAEQNLEGIVAKRVQSHYLGTRSKDWLKIKCQHRQEFVVGGYTAPKGARDCFGALHIGLYEDKDLVYVSKVGTGFDQETLRSIWGALQLLRQDTTPFTVGSPGGRNHFWVEPKIVCEVRFTEWTKDGGIRHPVFMGLRHDKRPENCRREEPIALPSSRMRQQPTVVITRPDKIFWPKEGYTKGDLIAYYETVAPLLLPYLKDRPLVLTRYPDGIDGKSFFQKDAPGFVPDWVTTQRIYSKDANREINYFIVNDVEALRYVVNLGAIPLHIWSSRIGSLDHPDWLILDLDPKGAPFPDVVKLAGVLHRILKKVNLPSYVKTSGATGLHILVPLGGKYTHEEARNFARLLALLGVEAAPGLATISRSLKSRSGRVYIDYVQNGHGRTMVAPFSARPLPGAPVSCPLRWAQLSPRLNPGEFTIKTVTSRFKNIPDPLAPVLSEGAIDMGAALRRIELFR